MNAQQLIEKRKKLWEAHQGYDKDNEYIHAVAEYLISEKGQQLRREIQEAPEHLVELFFYVVNKEQKTVPFFLNTVQIRLLATINQAIQDYKNGKRLHLNFLILKGRQAGFTTVITAYQLARSITQKNFAGFTLADDSENTETIFTDKAKYVYDMLPDVLKPTEKYNNRRELHFEKLNSRWRVSTAGGKGVGRSKTLNFFHGSESAFWDNIGPILTGLKPALTKDSIQILETTANGFNEYKELWDADNNWQNLFFEWWQTPEYRQSFEDHEKETEFKTGVIGTSQQTDDANSKAWVFSRCKWLIEEQRLEWSQVYWYYNQWKDFKADIKQEYPCFPEEAFISSGQNIFEIEPVMKRIQVLKQRYVDKPYMIGDIAFDYITTYVNGVPFQSINDSTIEFVEHPNGRLKVYKAPNPLKPYVIAGDIAEGGADFTASHVLDNTTLEQVAVWHGHTDTDKYSHDMYALGKWYNEALIGIEVNFDRHPVKELQRLHYNNQYMRQNLDTYTNEYQKKLGFHTNSINRPVIINDLVSFVRDHIGNINDIETLNELLTFVRNDNGKPEALPGKHDDLVLSLAIGLAIRHQQRMKPLKPKKELTKIQKHKQEKAKALKAHQKRVI